jgi:hypothetical protein
MAAELTAGITLLLVAYALVWFGRLNSHGRFMSAGVVYVSYPAVVLVFNAVGLALLGNALR